MIIEKLNIVSFGNIVDKSISFTDGINVIYGENEAGKSTILSFIRFIFYGLSGRKSDLKKYQPLSGEKISGSMIVDVNGTKYEISRNMKFTKAKQVSVVNLSTGDVLDKDFCDNVGQNLLKIGNESFVNTLFIGQNNIKISGDNDEILSKLSNLNQTGDEDISYNEIIAKIENDIANMESSRRKNAIIPNIETEINDIKTRIFAIKDIDERKNAYENGISDATLAIKNKQDEKENLEKMKKVSAILEKRKKQADEKNNISRLRAEIETDTNNFNAIIIDENFKNIDYNEEFEFLNDDNVQFDEKIEQIENEQKNLGFLFKLFVSIGVGLGILGIIFGMFTSLNALFVAIPIILIGAIFIVIGALKIKSKSILNAKMSEIVIEKEDFYSKKRNFLSKYNAKDKEDYLNKKNIYEKNSKDKEILAEKIRFKKENLKFSLEMFESGNDKSLTNDENLDTIKVSDYKNIKKSDEIEAEIRAIDGEISSLTEILHKNKFALIDVNKQLENVISLKETLDVAKNNLKQAKKELEVLEIAKKYITESFEQIKSNFAPSLAKNTAKIFSEITDNKKNEVLINEKLDALVKIGNSYENSMYLSGGTLDQLYFSVRLSLVNTIKQNDENYPIILDDAFAFFDDTRLKNILGFLKEYAKKAQVIISSCHDRELKHYENDGNIIRL